MIARYQITERRFSAYSDPEMSEPAQAMARYSGVYDLRDTASGNVITATASGRVGLRALRKSQARLNSNKVSCYV